MTKSAQKAESWDPGAMLLAIGQRLNHHRMPTETQRDFLCLLGSAISDGLPLEEALIQSKPPEKLPGKQSSAYRAAKQARDRRLRQAFELLDGSPWSRCSKIASDLSRVRYAIDHAAVLPDDGYTLLLVKAVQTGIRIVTTAPSISNIVKN